MEVRYTHEQKHVYRLIEIAWPQLCPVMEHPVGEFALDIYIRSVNLDIEIQGPQHYRKKTLKREQKLREYGIKHFLYIPVSDARNTQLVFLALKDKLEQIKKEEGEEGTERDNGCCIQSQSSLDRKQV